jgi:hypothetical protein
MSLDDTRDEAERVRVYLDGGEEPIAEYRPPARLDVDTRQLEDGKHALYLEATDTDGTVGQRTIDFEVRNGPAIAVDGLEDGEVVNGDLSMMVHAWGGADAKDWEPGRAESPAPAPTWAWVLVLVILAWALYYGITHWNPSGDYAESPTYPAVEQTEQ